MRKSKSASSLKRTRPLSWLRQNLLKKTEADFWASLMRSKKLPKTRNQNSRNSSRESKTWKRSWFREMKPWTRLCVKSKSYLSRRLNSRNADVNNLWLSRKLLASKNLRSIWGRSSLLNRRSLNKRIKTSTECGLVTSKPRENLTISLTWFIKKEKTLWRESENWPVKSDLSIWLSISSSLLLSIWKLKDVLTGLSKLTIGLFQMLSTLVTTCKFTVSI